jgi:hypothetical protein
VLELRVKGEARAQQCGDERADHEKCSFVEAVTQRSAPERARDKEGKLKAAGESDPKAGMRFLVHLIRNRDDCQVTAE